MWPGVKTSADIKWDIENRTQGHGTRVQCWTQVEKSVRLATETLWILSEEKQEHRTDEERETDWICHRVSIFFFILCMLYLTLLMSFNRPSPVLVTPCCYCCLDNDVITGRSPCVRPCCPRSPDFSCLYSLFAPGWVGAGLWPHCLGINTSHIGPSIHPGHKNLLTVSLGVINTPEYNVELINRCYLLFTTSSAGFQWGSMWSQRVGADVNVGYFVEPNKCGTENCL